MKIYHNQSERIIIMSEHSKLLKLKYDGINCIHDANGDVWMWTEDYSDEEIEFIVEACNNYERVTAQRDALLKALNKLACLGNGDMYGTSEGNRIAQKAIAEAEM